MERDNSANCQRMAGKEEYTTFQDTTGTHNSQGRQENVRSTGLFTTVHRYRCKVVRAYG